MLLWLFSKRNTLQVAIRLEHHSSLALHQRKIPPSPVLIIHSLNIKLAFVPLASHFAEMIFVILQITHFVLHPLNSMHSMVLFPFIRVQFYNMLPHFFSYLLIFYHIRRICKPIIKLTSPSYP